MQKAQKAAPEAKAPVSYTHLQAAHAEALFGVLDEKEQDSLYRLLQKLSCAWAEMARQKEAGE